MLKANNKITNDFEEIILPVNAPEANLQLADPGLVSFYRDFQARCLWIDKNVDDSLFCEIRCILQWNREDEQQGVPVEERVPIKLMIHSYGGNLDACYALIDVITLSKTPIYTVNLQCAMSSGCLIFINGHKRYCMPKSQALLHSGSGNNAGTYDQVMSQAENYKKLISMMQENILEHTKVDQKTLKKWQGKEIYLYAEDQINFGLADEIIKDLSIIL